MTEPAKKVFDEPVPVTVVAEGTVYRGKAGFALCRRTFGDGIVDFVVQLDHWERPSDKVLVGFRRHELRAPGGAL